MKRPVDRRSRLAAALGAVALILAAPAAPMSAGEHAVARISFEFTCNAATYPRCAPYLGFRYTATLWADGTGETQGAVNTHERGGPSGAASPVNDEIEWTATTGPLNLAVGEDPADLYFNLGLGTLSFPQTAGHYSGHALPGLSFDVTIIRY